MRLRHRVLSSSSVLPAMDHVCNVRSELLDRLAGAVEQLGRAKLDLRECLEHSTAFPGRFISGEVDQLRAACGLIRAELEYHRASHGC